MKFPVTQNGLALTIVFQSIILVASGSWWASNLETRVESIESNNYVSTREFENTIRMLSPEGTNNCSLELQVIENLSSRFNKNS